MALFKVKVSVLAVVEIPVFADSEDKALAYVKSTDEWKNDDGFSVFDTDRSTLAVVGAEAVTEPKLAPYEWEGDCLCWGDDEITIAQAFYGSPPLPDTDEQEDPEGDKLAWDAYFDAEKALIVQFNKAREG